MKYVILFLFCLTLQLQASNPKFADRWVYKGVVINDPNYNVYGASPIWGEDGRVHLFAARWHVRMPFDIGWRAIGEICHYVADNPEGPFTFVDVIARGSEGNQWDKCGLCNPTVHKVGDKYVLFYTSNDGYTQPPHPANQKIGMLIADKLDGPWKRVGKDGCILRPSNNPSHWTYNSWNGVNNPAFLINPKGGYLLYFKSSNQNHIATYGVALAENLEGPYVIYPEPITHNNLTIEDGYSFMYDGKICLLTTDNHGIMERGGGILWKSEDGIHFNDKELGFHIFKHYLTSEQYKDEYHVYGNLCKLERPQVLMKDGIPLFLYAPTGTNINGGKHTVPYVLKFDK